MEQHGHLMTNPRQAFDYVLGGRSLFTLVNTASGNHRTYRVSAPYDEERDDDDPKRPERYFVRVKTGEEFQYMGMIDGRTLQFRLTRASKMNADSPSVLGFTVLLWNLQHGKFPRNSEFWHSGSCGVCGRTLTNPESIESGIGPYCAGRIKGYNLNSYYNKNDTRRI